MGVCGGINSINPFAAFYNAISGENIITGRPLSSIDRLEAWLNSASVVAGGVAGLAERLGLGTVPRFVGTDKPWTSGATPDSIYTYIDPRTGRAVQNAIYDSQGNVIGHVDFKTHGPDAPSGHGHIFPEPGNPASGHGPQAPHIPNSELPSGWSTLPPGVQPHTPIGG